MRKLFLTLGFCWLFIIYCDAMQPDKPQGVIQGTVLDDKQYPVQDAKSVLSLRIPKQRQDMSDM